MRVCKGVKKMSERVNERGIDVGIGGRVGEDGRSGVPTAAIFAWRLGGMRVAEGAFRFAIFGG